ncbi:tetratricopeptide repeat protein [Candidatus Riflebacteria bacterium]
MLDTEVWKLYQERAEEHFRNHFYDQAIVEYKNALREKGDLFDAKLNLAALYILKNRLKEAESTLESLLNENKEHPAIFFNLAKIAMRKNKMVLAEQYLEKARLLDPDNFTIKKNLAFIFFSRGHFQKARELLHEIKDFLKEDADIPYFLGRICLEKGDDEEAVEQLLNANRLRENHFHCLYYLSLALYKCGHLKKCHLYLKKTRLIEKQHVLSHQLLIELLFQLGPIESVIEEIKVLKTYDDSKKTLELEKKAIQLYQYHLSQISDFFLPEWQHDSLAGDGDEHILPPILSKFIENSDFEDALTFLKNPDNQGHLKNTNVQLETAYILRLAGYYEDCVKIQKSYIKESLENYRYLYNYLIALIRSFHLDEARDCMQKLLKHYPNKVPSSRYLKGLISLSELDFHGAFTEFQQYPVEQPGYPEVLNEMSLCHFLNNEPENALDCLKKALSFSPKNCRFFHRLGCFYATLERWEELTFLLKQYGNTFEEKIPYLDLQILVQIHQGNEKETIALCKKLFSLRAFCPEENALKIKASLFLKKPGMIKKFFNQVEKHLLNYPEILFHLAIYYFLKKQTGKFDKIWTRFWVKNNFYIPINLIPFLRLTMNKQKMEQLYFEMHKLLKLYFQDREKDRKKIEIFSTFLDSKQ